MEAFKKKQEKEREKELAKLNAQKEKIKNYKKERARLIAKYEKLEQEKIKKLEEKINHLEKRKQNTNTSGQTEGTKLKDNKNTDQSSNKPRYKTKMNSLRKWGLSVMGVGVLSTIIAVGAGSYRYMAKTEAESKSNDDYDWVHSDNNSSVTTWKTWDSSEAKPAYENFQTATTIVTASLITSAVLLGAGTVLYFLGGEDKIQINKSINNAPADESKSSFNLTPIIDQNSMGLSLSFQY
jgi:hypothetical protein